MWRTVTSKDYSLTKILMHIVYKDEIYIANIILRDFRKKKISLWITFFLPILYEILRFDLRICDDFRNSK